MCNTRKSARCASLGMLVSFVTDSYEKQTIARHKGSKIKAWKEKAVEKKKRKTRKERERKKGEKAPFNALGSTVHVSSPTFHPALFLLASHFLIIRRCTIAREFARKSHLFPSSFAFKPETEERIVEISLPFYHISRKKHPMNEPQELYGALIRLKGSSLDARSLSVPPLALVASSFLAKNFATVAIQWLVRVTRVTSPSKWHEFRFKDREFDIKTSCRNWQESLRRNLMRRVLGANWSENLVNVPLTRHPSSGCDGFLA